MMSISRLKQIDGLRPGTAGSRPLWLHNDHRWTLPLIAVAQEDELIPRPCHLIVFDRHHDTVTPNCLRQVQQIRVEGAKIADLVTLCERHLRTHDDDWIKVAMEIGLVDHAVVFGVEEKPLDGELDFIDHQGQPHRIVLVGSLGGALEYQGDLSDLARSNSVRALWDLLGWEQTCAGLTFATDRPRIFLTIDLDCFIVSWRDYLFPWPEEVYANEFLLPSTYWSTKGWTGKKFLRGLLDGAGVLDIAREPDCCGGNNKADRVLADLNRHLFDGTLQLE